MKSNNLLNIIFNNLVKEYIFLRMLLGRSKQNAYQIIKRCFSSANLRDIEVVGEGIEKRSFLVRSGARISPWHDLPIQLSKK